MDYLIDFLCGDVRNRPGLRQVFCYLSVNARSLIRIRLALATLSQVLCERCVQLRFSTFVMGSVQDSFKALPGLLVS